MLDQRLNSILSFSVVLFFAPSIYWQNIDEVLLLAIEWWSYTSIQTPIYTFKITNTRIYLRELFFSRLLRFFLQHNYIFFLSFDEYFFFFVYILRARKDLFFWTGIMCFNIANHRHRHRRRHWFFFIKKDKKSCWIVAIKKIHQCLFHIFLIIFSFLCLWFIKRKNNTSVLKTNTDFSFTDYIHLSRELM